jgi:hypothetical protein
LLLAYLEACNDLVQEIFWVEEGLQLALSTQVFGQVISP